MKSFVKDFVIGIGILALGMLQILAAWGVLVLIWSGIKKLLTAAPWKNWKLPHFSVPVWRQKKAQEV